MPNEHYKEWVKKAEGDYRTAIREYKVIRQPNYDDVCYHSQPCAEKYLKAFRVFSGLPYKRTHAFIPLLEDCIDIDNSFESIRTYCDDITGTDQFRYPGDFAVKEDAGLALNCARIIRKFVRNKLGLNKKKREKLNHSILGSNQAL